MSEPNDFRVHFACGRALIVRIDDWRRGQPALPSRSEAIRLLLENMLDIEDSVAPPQKRPPRRAAQR